MTSARNHPAPDNQGGSISSGIAKRRPDHPMVPSETASNALYRAIGESIDYGVWVCGPDGRNTYASDSFLKLVGLTQEQCSNFGWGEVLHPDELEDTVKAWKECVAVGGNWDREHRFRGVDGKWYHILARGVPVKDESGRILCWTGINLDITDRKRSADALLESEKRYRVLAETMLQGVVHQDASGRIIAMNPAAERILGKSREQLLGHDSTGVEHHTIHEDGSLFPGEEHPSVVALKTGKEQRAVIMGVFNPQREEYRWISIDAVPVFREGETRPVEVYAVFDDITDRMRHAATLEESESRFRQIANAAPVLIWISDITKKCVWVNKAWLDFTGRTMSAEYGDGWLEDIHPEDRSRCVETFDACFDTRQPFEMEYRFRHHDGDYRWLLDRGVARFSEGGTFLGFIGSCVDISAHKLAEAASLASHQRLQNVLGSITDGLAVLDKNWRYTYFSDQAARIIGMKPEQLLGGCIWDLFPATLGNKFHEYFRRAVATGQRLEFEEYYPEPINKWLQCHCYPSSDGLSVYFHDVTVRKQAEVTLRQNEALFSTLIEQAPLGVYVVDDQFRLQQVNSIALPVFAAVRPLIGRDFTEVMEILWGPEVGGECARIFRHTLVTGESYISPQFNHARQDLGVAQSYDWETKRVTFPDGRHGVVCYFSDVTERHRDQATLEAAKAAAETANASKDRFLAVLSHELRTPLTPVLMVASALEHDPSLRPEVREDIVMIKRNIELETKLIDDLLDLSRITSGKVELRSEAVDLNEAVRQVCGICMPQLLEKKMRLETIFSESTGFVSADPARLQQILWNVLKNAVKFTPPEGVIRVTTVRLGPDRCAVRVKDNGIGIPPEVLPRIFNAFEQGDVQITRQFGGLGLGLAISKALAELHGGTIRAESGGSGHGTTFTVELPGRAVAATVAPFAGAPAINRGTPLRLLLVEDHADTARALARLLRGAGFSVLTAGDVASAIATAERESFDLLISDLGLPDGDGYQIMRAVHALRIVPGIAMSGYGMEEDVRRSTEAGFTEHLIKPVAIPQLIAAIQRVAENRHGS